MESIRVGQKMLPTLDDARSERFIVGLDHADSLGCESITAVCTRYFPSLARTRSLMMGLKARMVLTACVCGVLGWSLISFSNVHAQKNYFEAFKKKYEDLKDKADEAKCAVCHPNPDSKKERNDYGKAFGKALGTKKEKNEEKIKEALKKIEGKKAPNGKTFGENIKAGELPCPKGEEAEGEKKEEAPRGKGKGKRG